jgi:two-component system sensor histidine kinase BarA
MTSQHRRSNAIQTSLPTDSLGFKLALFLSLCLTATIGVYSWYTTTKLTQTLGRSLHQQAQHIALSLSSAVIAPLSTKNYIEIETVLLANAASGDIRAIYLVDHDGTVLTHIEHRETNAPPLARFSNKKQFPPVNSTDFVELANDELTIWQPVTDSPTSAWTAVVLDASHISNLRQQMIFGSIGFALISVFLGGTLLLLMLRPHVKAIHHIADFAQNLDQNLGKQLSVTTDSREITQLRDAINHASARLGETNAALWESERLFTDLCENIQSIFWIASLDTNELKYVSPAYETIWGRSRDSLIQNPGIWKEAIVEEDRQRVEKLLPDQINGNFDCEYRIRKPDGEVRWIRDRAFVVKDPCGKPTRLAGIAVDITERRLAEEQERAFQSTMAVQKALIKKNQELDEARRRALEASKTKSRFLANISHEVRTPIHAVVGFANLLLRSDLSRDQHEHVGLIKQSAEHLLFLINDILDFSRLDANKMEFQDIPFNLTESVDYVFSLLSGAARKKTLEMVPIIQPGVPRFLSGDPVRFHQILINLLDNAVKFTEQGFVTLEIGVQEQTAENATLHFTVSDSGCGIAPEQQTAIFREFAQVDSSYTRQHPSAGLGLAIVKRLVEKLGGSISVSSTPGQGSTFEYSLTYKKQAQQPDPAPGRHVPAHVYLLDSRVKTRASLTAILDYFHLPHTNVENVELLLEAVQHAPHHPDQPIVAIVGELPGTTGDVAYQRLTDIKSNADVRTLVLTDTHETHNFTQLSKAGVDALIAQPAKALVLYNTITSLVRKERPVEKDVTTPQFANASSGDAQLRILLADDNPINTRLLTEIIDSCDMIVDAVTNGEEAVEAFQSHYYDLIIADLHMPKMNGFHAAATIRSLESGISRTPIVALTADAFIDKQTIFSYGIDDVLIKPCDELTILDMVAKWTGIVVSPGQYTQPDETAGSATAPSPTTKPGDQGSVLDENDQLSVIDTNLGLKLANHKADLAEELLGMLIKELPWYRRKLVNPNHVRKLASTRELLHKLLGATRYCGVPALSAAVRYAELAVREGDHEMIELQLSNVVGEIDRLLAEYAADFVQDS